MNRNSVAGKPDVLVVTDVQNDFCPGGSLAVPGGHEILPFINRLAVQYENVVLTQDWHPAGHMSFASAHPGHKVFEAIDTPWGRQTLWPDHCVQGTLGADFHPGLSIPHAALILRKGHRREIDCYSAFHENDRMTPTGLAGYLRERGIPRLVFVGLATDFCIRYSALDARNAGFEVAVLLEACRAIDLDGSLNAAMSEMAQAGIHLVLPEEG
jgi:nicotinamidase/pyrazinamidase